MHNFNLVQPKFRKQRIIQRAQHGLKINARAKQIGSAVNVLQSFKWDADDDRTMYSPLYGILQRQLDPISSLKPLMQFDFSSETSYRKKYHEIINSEIRSCINRVFNSKEPICSIISRRLMQKADKLEEQSKRSPSTKENVSIFPKTAKISMSDFENEFLKTNSMSEVRSFSRVDQNEFNTLETPKRTFKLDGTSRQGHYDVLFHDNTLEHQYTPSNQNLTPNSFLEPAMLMADDFSLKRILESVRRFETKLILTNRTHNQILVSKNISDEIFDEPQLIRLPEVISPVTSSCQRNYSVREMSIYSGVRHVYNYTSIFDENVDVCGYAGANKNRREGMEYEEDIFSFSFVQDLVN